MVHIATNCEPVKMSDGHEHTNCEDDTGSEGSCKVKSLHNFETPSEKHSRTFPRNVRTKSHDSVPYDGLPIRKSPDGRLDHAKIPCTNGEMAVTRPVPLREANGNVVEHTHGPIAKEVNRGKGHGRDPTEKSTVEVKGTPTPRFVDSGPSEHHKKPGPKETTVLN